MTDTAEITRLWRQEGVLAFQQCRACGQTIFYARTACPNCWSSDLTIKRSSGTGRIATVTFVRKGLAAEFAAQAPIVLAEIDLDDGFTVISRVICPSDSVTVGCAVTLVGPTQASLYQLPTFALVREPQ
jgi:uncharacterized OB-fold protein